MAQQRFWEPSLPVLQNIVLMTVVVVQLGEIRENFLAVNRVFTNLVNAILTIL